MARPHQLSIRARLTTSFLVAIAALFVVVGFALVNLVNRVLVTREVNQIEQVMAQTQARFALAKKASSDEIVLRMQGEVVVQVTNLAGTQVWAASSAVADEPVLAHAIATFSSPNGLGVALNKNKAIDAGSELSNGIVHTITTKRGGGLIFGFTYGQAARHSQDVLLLSLGISFPLLLLVFGGVIWFGLGLALAPVEAIRRRVDAIAAQDLSERVPVTGGDDEIARMARTVNGMLDRLETASHFQQEFISNASHELRSPLTTLLATVQRAQGDPTETNMRDAVESVLREGRRLDAIIEDLFWLARNDEGRIEVRPVEVDLDDLLFEEASRVRAMSDLSVSTVNVQPTRIVGDLATLTRMVRNVVDNAMRYATSALTFSCERDGDVAVMRISDDGEGVELDSAERLFERFKRSDSARARALGGTGLGLAIVADIARRHGGRAQFVASERGSTLEIRLRGISAS